MKVLMQARQNLFTLRGGDTIQILKTKEYLEKLGVEVDVSTELTPALDGYDLVHLFNLTRVQETIFQVRNAKSQGKKVVFSTVYWPSDEFEKKGQVGVRKVISNIISIDSIERMKAIYKYYLKDEKNDSTKYLISNSFTKLQKEILNLSDWFLPNSILEMEEIKKKFSFSTKNITVVPNAIDNKTVELSLEENSLDEKYAKYKDYIVCVGRIETRKNQLNIVNALKGTNYKVLFVGKVSPGHKKYGEKVLEGIKENNWEYIEQINNDELYKLYKHCKVHVLPSWLETPGLVSLEAAVMGCNVVVSDRGTTKDYFKKYAYYCEPDDENTILEAINKAYSSKYDKAFRKYILENYVWDKAAEATLNGYKSVLNTTEK